VAKGVAPEQNELMAKEYKETLELEEERIAGIKKEYAESN
jgi:hypothetical protein